MNLSKEDAKRALIRFHFRKSLDLGLLFDRLRSIQFDPIAPVGCNHDLVIQARLDGYQIGDWNAIAYDERLVYDGWDKQASLVPFEGWNDRRFFYELHREWFEKRVLLPHQREVESVLREIEEKGAMRPRDFEVQMRRAEWEGSWFGPNLTKNILKALWHSGEIMTANRVRGQHVYDLSERVLPSALRLVPQPDLWESKVRVAFDRHLSMGMVRPTSNPEIWSNSALNPVKKKLIQELLDRGEIHPVLVDGVIYHAPMTFIESLDEPDLPVEVTFIAPLDPFMWDRKMISHLFDFEYIWEIYTPEAKRKWGYYVLPVRYGNDLVAKIEMFARKGVLEIRRWHLEKTVDSDFSLKLSEALEKFMTYASCGDRSSCVAGFLDGN